MEKTCNMCNISLDIINLPRKRVEIKAPGDSNFLLGEFGGGTGGGPDSSLAVLSLGYETVVPGYNVVVPLYLNSTVSVGGVQFDISIVDVSTLDLLVPVGIESNNDCFTANFNNLNGHFLGIIFSLEGCEYGAYESHTLQI